MNRLTAGQPAPDFTLPDQDGQPVSLSQFRGKKVLVYFYPRASTPGCTTQACGLRDTQAELAALNTQVLGISPDPSSRLKNFQQKQRLNFTLLGDERIRVLMAEPLERASRSLPGTIVNVGSHGLEVACGEGVLLITEIQLAGKKAMRIADVLNGLPHLFQVNHLLASSL